MVITIRCPSCSTAFPVDPEKVPEGGVRARCSACAHIFRVERPEAPLPDAAGEGGLDEAQAADATDPSETEEAATEGPLVDEWVVDTSMLPEAGEGGASFDESLAGESGTEETAESAGTDPTDPWATDPFAREEAPTAEPATESAPDGGDGTTAWVDEVLGAGSASDPDTASGSDFVIETEGSAEEETEAGDGMGQDQAELPSDWVIETEESGLDASDLHIETLDTGYGAAELTEPSAMEGLDTSSLLDETAGPGSTEEEADGLVLDTPLAGSEEPMAPAEEAGASTTPGTSSYGAFTFGKRDPTDKARRLARVLVSDMIMYNPDRHERALANGTLKEDFDDEIQKSWREYVEQVGEEMANGNDFWREALNDVLARGQEVF